MSKGDEEKGMIALRKLFLFSVIVWGGWQTMYGMNILRPYDTLIRPAYTNDYRFQVDLYAQGGVADKGYNADGCSTNALRIWSGDQDALAMLDGFPSSSTVGQKRIAVDANDDGVRGHFCVDGDLRTKFSGAVGLRAFFKEAFSISAYLPFYVMELDNVCWSDQTKSVSDEDERVKSLLTNDFFANVRSLGDGLDLGGWKRHGIGDITVLGEWFHDFPQPKELLKNVRINLRAGLNLPTGLREDEDKILAVPFGTDGALGLPFGLGLDLRYVFYLRAGVDVQLTHVFGNTRMRRVRTNENQTDFLLLEKMNVYKDFGLTQQFNLYVQIHKLIKQSSLLVGYQFIKHGTDELSLCSNPNFSSVVANGAEHLKDKTIHQIIVRADYDIGGHFGDHPSVYPRVSLYARFPFKGKRVAVTTDIGLTLSLDF